MPILLADLYLILPRQFQPRPPRPRPAAGEVDCSTGEAVSGKIQQLLGKFLGDRSGELAAMDKLQLPRLLRHGIRNFADTMSNKVHRRRSREIQVAIAVAIPNVNALAPHGLGIRLLKRPPQHRRTELLLGDGRPAPTRIL